MFFCKSLFIVNVSADY